MPTFIPPFEPPDMHFYMVPVRSEMFLLVDETLHQAVKV